MKKLLLVAIFAIACFGTASAQFEIEGKVFYDSTQTQLKEVYHYILSYKFSVNRSTGDTVINPEPTAIRHGVCILYRKDGTIEATGQYSHGKRTGVWFFYDERGKNITRQENFG